MWSEFEREFFDTPRRIRGVQDLLSVWVLQDLDDREAGFIVAIWTSELSARTFEDNNPLPGDFEFHLGEIRSSWVAPAMDCVPMPQKAP
jgi:hypothetical protein